MIDKSPQPDNQASDEAPASVPQITPIKPGQGHPEYHFIQSLLELQKSIGSLTSDVKHILDSQVRIESRIDKLEESNNSLSHKIYAAGIIVTIIICIGGFLADKAWDKFADNFEVVKKTETQKPQPKK